MKLEITTEIMQLVVGRNFRQAEFIHCNSSFSHLKFTQLLAQIYGGRYEYFLLGEKVHALEVSTSPFN